MALEFKPVYYEDKLSVINQSGYAGIVTLWSKPDQMEKEISSRWNADMKSDSWLSKNVRPLVLVFLVVATVLMIFIDAGTISFNVEAKWTDLLQLVLITVIGAYFGGRSLEKVKK